MPPSQERPGAGAPAPAPAPAGLEGANLLVSPGLLPVWAGGLVAGAAPAGLEGANLLVHPFLDRGLGVASPLGQHMPPAVAPLPDGPLAGAADLNWPLPGPLPAALAPVAAAPAAGPAGGLLEAARKAGHGAGDDGALAYALAAAAQADRPVEAGLVVGGLLFLQGRYDACAEQCRRVLALHPGSAEAHSTLGDALQQLGRVDEGIAHYQRAIALQPDHADAYNKLGGALVQKALFAQAVQCYNGALQINNDLYVVHNNLGDLWRMHGPPFFMHALRCYCEALRANRQYVPAWQGMADTCWDMSDFQRALGYYQQVLALQPDHPKAASGLGLCYKALGFRQEATLAFAAAVQKRPDDPLALMHYASCLAECGALAQAIGVYRRAVQHDPYFPEAFNNLGNVLRELGNLKEAEAAYVTCIQLQHSNPSLQLKSGGVSYDRLSPAMQAQTQSHHLSVVYSNLGGVYKLQNRIVEAIQCYQQVVYLMPGSPEGHANLASSYKDCGRHEESIVAYSRALALRPDFPDAFANYVHSLQCVCDWENRDLLFQRLFAETYAAISNNALPTVQPFHAMAYPTPPELVVALSRAYAAHCLKNALSASPLPPLRHPEAKPVGRGQRLKVGYVSSDFGNHPLSHLMRSVFGMHDRSRFEVFAYALSPPDGSKWRAKIEADVEHFLDVSAWAAHDTAARINADGVQILINLNGYTKGAKNEVFALRPAPVQASYMGFPSTLGADYVPYMITDRITSPPEFQHYYTEKFAYMPHCYFVNDYRQSHMDSLTSAVSRADYGLPEDKVVFSCSNQLYKYDPQIFATWCNILRRVPDSVLWLLRFPPSGEPRIRREAAKLGVPSERIIFSNVAEKDVHIPRSGLADVFLDTPAVNAHTTGCDVLWSGCPIVTLPLQSMASRVAASLCHAAGCSETVVRTAAEYEELAVALGRNPVQRARLRKKLQGQRLTCELFDTEKWVADFERVLWALWARHAQGLAPDNFGVDA